MITKISCVVPYLNDILVDSKKFEDHRHIRLKLRRLRKKSVRNQSGKFSRDRQHFRSCCFRRKVSLKSGSYIGSEEVLLRSTTQQYW